MSNFPIGKLSKLTGCKIPTIRYYEEEGLLQGKRSFQGVLERLKQG